MFKERAAEAKQEKAEAAAAVAAAGAAGDGLDDISAALEAKPALDDAFSRLDGLMSTWDAENEALNSEAQDDASDEQETPAAEEKAERVEVDEHGRVDLKGEGLL